MNERTTTRSDYAERLERVFGWLADHLDDTLDLTRLAEVACLSPYHFHRVYRAMQGETAADTVRRLFPGIALNVGQHATAWFYDKEIDARQNALLLKALSLGDSTAPPGGGP